MCTHRKCILSIVMVICVFTLWVNTIFAKDPVVGIAWVDEISPRWETSLLGLKYALQKAGVQYILKRTPTRPPAQRIESLKELKAEGATAIIVLLPSAEKEAFIPVFQELLAQGIPIVAFDRLLEVPGTFYVSFDNVEVGRQLAKWVYDAQPKGNYALVKGPENDLNVLMIHQGVMEILKPAIDRGDITIVYEEYTENWNLQLAYNNIKALLEKGVKIDAAVCSNDNLAQSVYEARRDLKIEGTIPLSGQDGENTALNRVARGLQTVSLWKDGRVEGIVAGNAAIELAKGTPPAQIKDAVKFKGPAGVEVDAVLIAPVPIHLGNLEKVLEVRWIKCSVLCNQIDAAKAPPVCQNCED